VSPSLALAFDLWRANPITKVYTRPMLQERNLKSLLRLLRAKSGGSERGAGSAPWRPCGDANSHHVGVSWLSSPSSRPPAASPRRSRQAPAGPGARRARRHPHRAERGRRRTGARCALSVRGFSGETPSRSVRTSRSRVWAASYFCPCRVLVKRTICLSP
jgi:hypothetical protein